MNFASSGNSRCEFSHDRRHGKKRHKSDRHPGPDRESRIGLAEPFQLQRREMAGNAGMEAIVIAEKIETGGDRLKRDPKRDPLGKVPHSMSPSRRRR
jgi:hypothetical protein